MEMLLAKYRWSYTACIDSFEVRRFAGYQQPDDKAEETQHGAEDLDDENLDKPDGIVSSLSSCLMKHQRTHRLGSAASARAAPLPLMPTDTPHTRLHMPTVNPDQNRA